MQTVNRLDFWNLKIWTDGDLIGNLSFPNALKRLLLQIQIAAIALMRVKINRLLSFRNKQKKAIMTTLKLKCVILSMLKYIRSQFLVNHSTEPKTPSTPSKLWTSRPAWNWFNQWHSIKEEDGGLETPIILCNSDVSGAEMTYFSFKERKDGLYQICFVMSESTSLIYNWNMKWAQPVSFDLLLSNWSRSI